MLPDADGDNNRNDDDQPPFDGLGEGGDACDPDIDGDGFQNYTESNLGSNPYYASSTPEHPNVAGTCTDGLDNDLDGKTDAFDFPCPPPPPPNDDFANATIISELAFTDSLNSLGATK